MADEFSQIPIDSVPSPVEDAFKDGHQSEHVSAPADEDTASTLEDRKRHPAKKRKGDVLSDGEPQDCDTVSISSQLLPVYSSCNRQFPTTCSGPRI